MFINESKTVQMWTFDSSLEVTSRKGREETRRDEKGEEGDTEKRGREDGTGGGEGRGERSLANKRYHRVIIS